MSAGSSSVDATDICTGSRSIWLAKARTSGGKVAEKNRLWRRGGSSVSTLPSSSAKPRSSSRSASSSTRRRTVASCTAFCAARSSSRPGVATSTSAPPRKAIICGLMETPPEATITFGLWGRAWAKLRTTSPTWAASSRVGTTINALIARPYWWRFSAGNSCRRCNRGSAKAAVLPEPVWADASTSAPVNIAGMASVCMGVGSVNPRAPAAWASVGSNPRERKGMVYCRSNRQRNAGDIEISRGKGYSSGTGDEI